MDEKLKIVFFGTPEFAVPSLKALIEAHFNIVAVVTQPDKPIGRKKTITSPPVKILAEQNNIQVLQPETLRQAQGKKYIDKIKSLKPDLFVIVAYGKILPQALLNTPKYGSINIHPSLLPKYRGPSPLQAQILNNESDIGVTIMLIDEEMDHGPTLASYKLTVNSCKSFNFQTLGQELFKLGAKHLPETINKYIAGDIKPEEQDHNQATFTKLIKKEDGKINWNKPADYIERMTRAYYPWPGTYFQTDFSQGPTSAKAGEKVIKILKAHISPDKTDLEPGTPFKSSNSELTFVCGDNSILIIDELQPTGKKKMTAQEFLHGHQL